MGCIDYIKKVLGEEEGAAFMKWAFGADWKIIALPSIEALSLWNRRHKDLLKIEPTDLVHIVLPKMVELYVDNVFSKRESYAKLPMCDMQTRQRRWFLKDAWRYVLQALRRMCGR